MLRLISLLVIINIGFADPLQEIEEAISKKEQRDNLAEWVDPATPFGRVMLNSATSSELSEWLSPSPIGIIETKRSVKRKPEYLQITHEYITREYNTEIYIKFYLPYPKYGPMTQYGLIDDLARLEPPKRAVLSSESILVGDIPATLFHEPKDVCSLLIKLPKFSYFEGTVKGCSRTSELIRLVTALNLKTVTAKLEE